MSKLGQAYTVLGFLKREKVEYIFDGKQYVLFPCFLCGEKLTMDAITTKWACEGCNESGTIITLHNIIQDSEGKLQKLKIYNPKRELDEVVKKLERSTKKYNDTSFLKLIEKIEILINYHKKETV